jgi:hypothetical protein
MNLCRFTVIAGSGGSSFVAHAEALPALLKACARQDWELEGPEAG